MSMKWLLAFVLLGACDFAHAEGGCPSGMIPYSGTDLSSCGPIPAGYYGNGNSGNEASQAVAPPVRWEDSWGAVAFSEVNAAVGVASNMANEQEARRAAIADCRAAGGENKCEVELSYYNQCGVVAWGEKYYATARAETISQASQRAINRCSEKTENCRVVYSDCSLPRRIQ